jgi:hypothetical protein
MKEMMRWISELKPAEKQRSFFIAGEPCGPCFLSQKQTGGISPEGIRMADNKTDPRQWTSEKPTKSGFYYYRQSNDEEPIVLKVEVLDGRKGLNSVVWLPGDNAAEPLEQCHGDWAGPIEPPA